MIYLDSASTTKVSESLKHTIDRYTYEDYGNAGSPHAMGRLCKKEIARSRARVAGVLNADPDGVIFTSSGSEANTLAIIGLSDYLFNIGKHHIVTTKYEHPSVMNAMNKMSRMGFEVTYLDLTNGVVNHDILMNSIRPDTGLVSVMYVNNEVGAINDIARIYQICRERDVLFHSDCVQAVGSEMVDLEEMADMISISGHKIHAPKGIGCLCIKNKNILSNIICGGGQEYGLRPGTENVAFISAFSEAIHMTFEGLERSSKILKEYRYVFEETILELCNKEGVEVSLISRGLKKTSPKISSIRFPGVDSETLLMLLSGNDVYVSSGSACSSNSVETSHVLKAIGLSDEEARSTIRVSFSTDNSTEDVRNAAHIIVDCVKTLLLVYGAHI